MTPTLNRAKWFTLGEAATGFLLIMLYIWKLRAIAPSSWILILAYLAVSHVARGDCSAYLGFRWGNLRECLEKMAPALLLLALVMLAGGLLLQTMRPITLERGCLCLVAYCPWGLVQQYLLNGYIANRLLLVSPARYVPLISATVFSGAHLPNLFLMVVTFATGYYSTRLFMRYRNLYFLGLAHGVIGTLIYVVIPDSITHHLVVGPGFFGR
jgi:hypothetical protein